MGFEMTKPVFSASNKASHKPVSSATETSKKNERSLVATSDDTFQKANNKGCVDAQAGLRLCCSQTLKTGFLASRPKYDRVG